MFETRNVIEMDEAAGDTKRDPIFEPLNTLYDDPVEVVQQRTAEQINIADGPETGPASAKRITSKGSTAMCLASSGGISETIRIARSGEGIFLSEV